MSSIICYCWFLLPNPFVPVYLGLIPIGIIVVIYFPVHMSLMFIVFSFFRIHEALPILYPLHIPLLLSLATIFSMSWHIFLSKEIKPYGSQEMYAFFVFFILVFIGVTFASNRNISMDYIESTYIKIAIMIPVLIWCIREIKHFKLTLLILTSAGLLIGLIAIYNKINKIGLVEGTRVTIGRDIGSSIGDPNDLSLVLLMPFSYAISLLITSKIALFNRLLGLVTTVTLFSAIIATQSRGGLLGILAVVGMVGYQRIKSKTLLFGIGGIFACALFIFAGISGRQSGGAAEAGLDQSAMGRIHAWEAAIGMAMDNPITGVGLENFYNNYWFYTPSWDGKNHVVHSTWFGVLAETGFVGLFVLLGAPNLEGKLIGVLLLLLGAFFWSLGMVMAKPLSKKIGGFAVTAWVSLFCGPMLLLGSFIFDGNTINYFLSADYKGWLIVAYLSLIMQPLAYGTWYHVMGRNPVHKVMPVMLLLPLTGLSTAIFLLGEEPTKQVFIGGAIILLGIGMILFTKTPNK